MNIPLRRDTFSRSAGPQTVTKMFANNYKMLPAFLERGLGNLYDSSPGVIETSLLLNIGNQQNQKSVDVNRYLFTNLNILCEAKT